jgi:hypothetical protein
MRRVVTGQLSSSWSDLLQSLFRDLGPLGHSVVPAADGRFEIRIAEIDDFPPDKDGRIGFYDAAHEICHAAFLPSRGDFIRAFEVEHADIFVRMDTFQPSAILPILEIVDFASPRHEAIIDYLCLYQTVTSRKRVGRRMGLLVWDAGQTAHRPLIGGAILASPRWSQALRDHYLGWAPDYPKTSSRHDAQGRAIRMAGLGRMMQLSVACALPPYNLLSGAWLIALSPFTTYGQEAFANAARAELDPDLAAVVTTTAKGPSGAPFRNHRIKQLTKGHINSAGNVFVRAAPNAHLPALRASFKDLVSPETIQGACDLFRAEFPSAPRDNMELKALKHMLRRLKLKPGIFDGNEIGVHVGMISPETKEYLSSGKSRPLNKRLRLNWDDVTAVWLRKFLPEPESDKSEDHKIGRRRRAEAARAYPEDQIRLSYHLSHLYGQARLSVSDLAPGPGQPEMR